MGAKSAQFAEKILIQIKQIPLIIQTIKMKSIKINNLMSQLLRIKKYIIYFNKWDQLIEKLTAIKVL